MFDQGISAWLPMPSIPSSRSKSISPRGRLVAVTGVSGSGKTTLVLETLIPALKAQATGERLPNTCAGSMPRVSYAPT
ncbi:MAG: hypothetical protein ACLU37_04230 [Collinsella sp.]